MTTYWLPLIVLAGAAPPAVALKTTVTPLGKGNYQVGAPVAVSRDGNHILYGVQHDTADGGQWGVAVDGVEDKTTYDQLGQLLFGADGKHWAFSGKRGDRWTAVLNGVEGKTYDAVDRLHFSADGLRVGYVAELLGQAAAVIDGVVGKFYGGVNGLVFSADGKHSAYIAARGTALNNHIDDAVVLDGLEQKPYPQIVPASVQLSPDGKRLALATASALGKVRVVVDGVPSKQEYDDVKQGPNGDRVLRFSPDGKHLAFEARRGEKWMLVVDDQEGPAYDDIKADSIRCGRDGSHWSYAALKGQKNVAVVDGKEGKECDETVGVRLSADGVRFAYVAREGDKQAVVTNEGEGKVYMGVGALCLGADGKHVAYRALRDDSTAAVVLDGKEQKAYLTIDDSSVRLSPDGKRLAYFAMEKGDPNTGGITRWFVLDGAETTAYGLDAPDGRSVTFGPDGKHAAFTVFKITAAVPASVVVVDGVESRGYGSPLVGGRLVFDGPNKLHLLGADGDKIVRVEVEAGGK